jgi:hypothetical protein
MNNINNAFKRFTFNFAQFIPESHSCWIVRDWDGGREVARVETMESAKHLTDTLNSLSEDIRKDIK